ncbi:hypothetical protein N0V90_002363 [Kalmusia sp. IMI 367209]|nr:hypothetical protein N0V90_002363 [Kalmusia sp. IMI 367209]
MDYFYSGPPEWQAWTGQKVSERNYSHHDMMLAAYYVYKYCPERFLPKGRNEITPIPAVPPAAAHGASRVDLRAKYKWDEVQAFQLGEEKERAQNDINKKCLQQVRHSHKKRYEAVKRAVRACPLYHRLEKHLEAHPKSKEVGETISNIQEDVYEYHLQEFVDDAEERVPMWKPLEDGWLVERFHYEERIIWLFAANVHHFEAQAPASLVHINHTFDISRTLLVSKTTNKTVSPFPDPEKPIELGGNPDIYTELLAAATQVLNTGSRQGSTVVQLYVTLPGDGQPIRVLRGFEKVSLHPGQGVDVRFALTRRDVSVWDTLSQEWLIPSGKIRLAVGFSSRDLPIEVEITLL